MRNIGHEIDAAIERQANEYMDRMSRECEASEADDCEECNECNCKDECSLYAAYWRQVAEEERAEAAYEESKLK